MAILILGSPCPLCGQPILDLTKVVGFPAFVSNEADPLYVFNDAAFHTTCFNAHPLAAAAQARDSECRRRHPPANRSCSICGGSIDRAEDYLGFGHLTDDPKEPAHKLNHLQFHRSCLSGCAELGMTRRILSEFNDSGNWKGDGLKRVIDELPEPEGNKPR